MLARGLFIYSRHFERIEYVTFQPNKIVYAIPQTSPSYETIKDAEFGIAFHTIYKDGGNGGKSQSFRVDLNRVQAPKCFYLMSVALNLDNSNDPFQMNEIHNLYTRLQSVEAKLNANPAYADLTDNQAFMGFWNTFENKKIADERNVTLNEDTVIEELWDYIEAKQTAEFTNKLQNLKTVKGKLGAIDKWVDAVAEMRALLTNNNQLIVYMVQAFNLAAQIKMHYWEGFKSAYKSDYDQYYLSRTKGYIPADMEGIAMSDSEGNVVKVVDRTTFSSYNRDPDIMAGWEHPEDKLKEDRSLGRQPKTYKQVSRGTTVIDSDGEPWTVIEKGSVAELNEKYPECKLYDAAPYQDAVYVGDGMCFHGHKDRGNHIFVYDDSWLGVLAYFDDGGFYIRESKGKKIKESFGFEGDIKEGDTAYISQAGTILKDKPLKVLKIYWGKNQEMMMAKTQLPSGAIRHYPACWLWKQKTYSSIWSVEDTEAALQLVREFAEKHHTVIKLNRTKNKEAIVDINGSDFSCVIALGDVVNLQDNASCGYHIFISGAKLSDRNDWWGNTLEEFEEDLEDFDSVYHFAETGLTESILPPLLARKGVKTGARAETLKCDCCGAETDTPHVVNGRVYCNACWEQ